MLCPWPKSHAIPTDTIQHSACDAEVEEEEEEAILPIESYANYHL